MDHILSRVPYCVSESMNQSLMATYTEGKIVEALKGMGPIKASVLDGFLALFYQKYRHIIGKDTSAFCLDILNNEKSLEELNKTHLVLIPKIANPLNLKSFLPISLCTIICKIIAKTIANLIQKVMNVLLMILRALLHRVDS